MFVSKNEEGEIIAISAECENLELLGLEAEELADDEVELSKYFE
jgi:hypothetical protein